MDDLALRVLSLPRGAAPARSRVRLVRRGRPPSDMPAIFVTWLDELPGAGVSCPRRK